MVDEAPEPALEERARRIIETTIELAEQGGFEAVRLRDVAAHAGVALGTLYRRSSIARVSSSSAPTSRSSLLLKRR